MVGLATSKKKVSHEGIPKPTVKIKVPRQSPGTG